MIPRTWERALSLTIVSLLLTGLFVITDFPSMDAVAVNHGGVISVNETWSGQVNHIILSNVTIKENITVLIEGGADIQFEDTGHTNIGPLSIFVNGTLIIDGTQADPVTFTSRVQASQKAPGDWNAVYYNATSNDTASRVSYAIMEFGINGIFLEDTSILIENSEITNMSQNGILSYASSPTIRNCTIRYNNYGIWAESGGEPLIMNNTIEWNMYDGIYGVRMITPKVVDNRIRYNLDDGVHMLAFTRGEITGNSVVFNDDNGIVLNLRADMLVKDNNVSRNGDAGIWMQNTAPTIQHNLITNNSRNGIRIFDCRNQEACPSPVIVNNTVIYNNRESGLYPGIFVENADPLIMKNYIAYNTNEGIYLGRFSGGNVSSNAIIDNYVGIVVNRSTTRITTNNPISGNWAGIYVKNKAEPFIEGNVLTNNKYGIFAEDDASPVIYRNVIAAASGKNLYVGDKEGKISFFENRGESVFYDMGRVKLDTGADVDVNNSATPTLGDIDEDGLDDLLVGDMSGFVHYYKNLGDGTFRDMGLLMNETPVTPLSEFVGRNCNPFVTDWDGDGDLDLFCGNSLGDIYYLTNNGNDVFTNRGRLKDGFQILDPGPKAAPFFIDWLGDGDRDLIAGNYYGDVKFYESLGIGSIGFAYSGFLKSFDGMSVEDISGKGTDLVPWMMDWDKDSKIDLITSNRTGVYLWKRSIADLFDPPVPLLTFDPPREVNARGIDWGGDGYYDLITGGIGGFVKYYRNDGLGSFVEITMQNGTKDLLVPLWSSPFPVDFDGDSILDLIVGDAEGNVWFFRGTSSGSPNLEFVSILTGSGSPQFIRVGLAGTGYSRPYAVDWNEDHHVDLVVGEANGMVWLFTNDGDETFSSWGMAHNETGKVLRGNSRSAPCAVDWDGDAALDLIVGDSQGYVHFWKGVDVMEGPFNFTDMGRLRTDGGYLKASTFAIPFVDDWNADGDLDILIGEVTGRVLYYENDGDGTLTFRGNISNVLGGDLKVSNNAAPHGLGYYGSLKSYKGGIGIASVDSSPDIRYNVIIKGGGGNRTAGEGEEGGIGIYLLRSNARIFDNKNISGGSGGLGISAPSGDVIGGRGGHGIFLDNSSGWIGNNIISGGMGGEAEAATFPSLSIGGDGGSGLYSTNNTTTYVSNNIIRGGEGNVGVDQEGDDAAGIWAEAGSQPYIVNCTIYGVTGVYVDNSTPYLVNSTIEADMLSFDIANHGHAIALNTTFDKAKTSYGDDSSILETQWFLHVKVVDRSGFPVPDATITLERDGFSYQGHLPNLVGNPITPNSMPAPAVVDWDEDGHQDLLVGENDGDVMYFRNTGDGRFETGVTLLRGVDVGMTMTRPFVYDLDFDTVPDVLLGDNLGRIFWYKKNGLNLEFYDTFKLFDDQGVPIGDVSVSLRASPSVGRWTDDGYWDLVVGDASGYVNVFARHPGSFTNFTYAGYAKMTDGTPVQMMQDAVPQVVDWNDDGYRDLILSGLGQVTLYLACDNGTLLYAGPIMANNSGLQPIQLDGMFSAATVLDYNGDGDLDLIVGAKNTSLINTGNIEYFESNKNGDSRTYTVDELGEKKWLVVTEFVESDKNGNHLGNDPGDKVYYTPHMIKAQKGMDIGCAAPQPVMTENREAYVVMCRDVTLPYVVDTYPKHGQSGVGLNEKIKVWFSKPMDRNSVEMKTSITSSPPVAYSVNWYDNDTLFELVPNPGLEYDTHYTVKIRGSAQDVVGLMLDGNRNGIAEGWFGDKDDYVFSFHTEYLDPMIPPVAVLEHWPWNDVFTFIPPRLLQFDGRNSTDDRNIEYWNISGHNGLFPFGYEGPDIENATTPPILFDVPGTYCINLTVWDGVGLWDEATQCLNINISDLTDPTADAGPDKTIAPGQMVTFDGSGSSDDVTPTALLNYTWTFNDGTADQKLYGMTASHSGFVTVGLYVVTLTVTDMAGNNDTDTMTVNVTSDPPPIAEAGPSQNICAGGIATLDASGTQDNSPLGNLIFNWTFNDGQTSVFLQGIVVTHQFNISGDFEITLNVTDESGSSDTDTTWINVTVCIPPNVTESAPRGPDKALDSVIWAKFSKEMKRPDLYFSFSLIEDATNITITGIPNYDNITHNFTFAPDAPLKHWTTYEACFDASIAEDIEGLKLDGNRNNQSEGSPTDDFCWTFQTVLTPTIDATVPQSDEPDVLIKTNIEISFNEPMDMSSVQLAFSMTDGTSVWDSTMFSVTWSIDSRVFIFADFSFEFSTSYSVTIDASIAISLNGVYLDGDSDRTPEGSPIDDYSWSFTTEASPRVTGIPTGSNVPLNANIVMSFNKLMDWASVESAITIREDGNTVPVVNFGATSWSDMSRTFTIDPFVMTHGRKYNITLSGDASSGAKDLNGNSLDGNKNGILEGTPTDDYSWEFITTSLDMDPPHVTSTTPEDRTIDVSLDTVIAIEFDELMNQTSFPTGIALKIDSFTFSLESVADFEWFDGNMTLLLYPIGGLEYDTNYTIIISGSHFNGVVDLAGNPLDGNGNGIAEGVSTDDYRFWFRTSDPIPLSVVNTTPYDGETNVSLATNISATFDDDMDVSTLQPENVTVRDQFGNIVQGQLSYDAQEKKLTFDPNQNLRPTRTYTVNISNVMDDEGNTIVNGYYAWSFETQVDEQPPTVVISYPLDGDEVTRGEEILITGTATDNSDIEILQIRFGGGSWIDIDNYNSTDGSWSHTWDTGGSSLGTVLIEVQAYDLSSLRGSDQISVDIREPEFDVVGIVLLALAIIIAVAATVIFILMWRRREAGEEELEPEEGIEEEEETGEEERPEGEEPSDIEASEESIELIEKEAPEGEMEEGAGEEETSEDKPVRTLKEPIRRIKK